MNKNQELHELLGRCWHEPKNMTEVYLPTSRKGSWICAKCDKRFTEDAYPDYAADSRLVLEGMMERGCWDRFWLFAHTKWAKEVDSMKIEGTGKISDFFLWLLCPADRTGKTRDLAIEFLIQEEGSNAEI